MTDFTPTAEQVDALDLFMTGDSLVIQARAGAGKTSTLVLLSHAAPGRTGQYLAFNRSIVGEAKSSMPDNVTASTIHSLAFRAYGKRFKARLDSPRMRSEQIAKILGIDPYKVTVGDETRILAAGFLAGHVMKAIVNFCQSDDDVPTERHVSYIDGIDLPEADGRRTYGTNNEVARYLLDFIEIAWADLQRTDGSLPYGHHCYLKAWQLSGPTIAADFILLDEAQDVAPVMCAIFEAQTHAQLIAVGDDAQEIYGFTGAINAMARMNAENEAVLSQSFRFGPEIADVANIFLDRLDTSPVRGTPSIESTVGPVSDPDCVLTRTNAVAVEEVMKAQAAGRRPHLMGGGKDVAMFARAARDLQDRGSTSHPDLACFNSWGEVLGYVASDPQGGDLRLLVKLVEDFGIDVILDALDNMVSEAKADVVVSTAHKSKGREWGSVRLAGDFNREDKDGKLVEPSDEELRLLYVAVTRAERWLDVSALRILSDDPDGDDDPEDDPDNDPEDGYDVTAKDADYVVEPETVEADPPAVSLPLPVLADDGAAATVETVSAVRSCPTCGRTDVVRANGFIGAHHCVEAAAC